MKFKHLFLIIALLAGQNLFSQDAKVKWYTFEEAIALNKEHPKKIFVDVYTDWCGWCKKMDQSTFQDPTIVEELNKNFYPVKLNAERKDTVVFRGYSFVNENPDGRRSTHQLAQALLRGKMSYPSYAFLNEKAEVITVVPGYHKSEEFEIILKYFSSDAFKTTQWKDFSASYQNQSKAQ